MSKLNDNLSAEANAINFANHSVIQLNRLAATQPFPVSGDMLAVIKAAAPRAQAKHAFTTTPTSRLAFNGRVKLAVRERLERVVDNINADAQDARVRFYSE